MEKKKKSFTQWIVPVLTCLVIGAFVLVIVFSNQEPEPEEEFIPYGYVEEEESYSLENDELIFTMDALTTQFTLTKKSTGVIWKSNPDGIDADTLALSVEKKKLKATMSIKYMTVNGVVNTYDNYEYSISRGLYEIEAGEDYIRVNYSVGDLQREYVIPPFCFAERFEEMLSRMDAADAKKIKNNYKLYDLENLGKKDNKEELLELYPMLSEGPAYIMRENTKEFMLGIMESAFEGIGYTYEEYEADLENFTSTSSSNKPSFNVSVIYRLEGNDLVAEVPMEAVEYRKDYPIVGITILPYYAAAGISDNGFIMVPEGGGALINFNSGKLSQNSYYTNLYGWNYAMERTSVVGETHAEFSMFGMCYTDTSSSVLCLIDQGAEDASISADIAGRYHSFNYANCEFTILHSKGYAVSTKTIVPVYVFESEMPTGSVTMRYRHIDTCDYVEIAESYREFIIQKGTNLEKTDSDSVPVVVEILGAVDKTQQVFGVPKSVPLALTTYKEAEQILSELYESGFSNLSVKLSGWVNGGIRQQLLTRIKPISSLGGEKALSSMTKTAKALGINLYLDGYIDFTFNNKLFDGFNMFQDSARFTDDTRVKLYSYSTVWYGQETYNDPYFLLNQNNRTANLVQLINAAVKYDTAGISLRDEGKYLSADYNEESILTRADSAKLLQSEFQELKEQGISTMISRGNDYAAWYADVITDMNLEGNRYTILDNTVPIYQMALHGYVDYTGESLNLEKDYQRALLNAAETGAGLKFTFMKEPMSTLQDTLYSQYYGADYDQWFPIAQEIYDRYNREMSDIFTSEITGYRNLTNFVKETTYSNGTVVYVNYGEDDYTDGTLTVPAKDYTVKKGNEQ